MKGSAYGDLRFLHSCYGSEAWVLMGDFNAVRRPNERLEGFDVRSASDFNSCVEDVEMQELVTKGYWYTWTNKRGGLGSNKSKLDRTFINSAWMDLFRDSEVVGFASGISDHCALVMTVIPNSFRACPFRFYNFWMKDNRFGALLSSSWGQHAVGNPMDMFSLKLKRLKPLLKAQ